MFRIWFVFCLAYAKIRAGGVADHYTLWLSDAAVGVQADSGDMVSMQFPAARRVTFSSDRVRVQYEEVFPGIDLAVYKNHGGFEYDWDVAPGADASAINVSFRGARDERIGQDGDLILSTSAGEVRHSQPFAYQNLNGRRQRVAAALELAADGRVRFRLGAYDRTRPLVIDPALSFVSGIGGSGISVGLLHQTPYTDLGSGVALDGGGNIYIAGLAYSTDFPLVNPLPISPLTPNLYTACPPTFVAKLSPDGKTILYSTLLTSCSLSPPAIAADTSGNVYIAGSVEAGGSLVQGGGGTATPNNNDAFVAKLDTNGVLKAAIAVSGSAASAATSIALGADGKLYVTGTTASPDFPVTTGVIDTSLSSSQDLFLIKLDPTLLVGNQLPSNSILYSTFLGSGSSPVVAADAAGNAYVAASTTSTAWTATPGVFQSQCWDASRTGCADVIALKLNSTGSHFTYTTYLGGSETETIGGLAVDSSGNAYITGTTNSFDFPTTAGAYVQQFDSGGLLYETSFVVKLSADASHLIYGTLLASDDSSEGAVTGSAIAIDASGDAWVGGSITAPVLPVQNGIQQTLFNAVCFSYTPSGSIPNGEYYCPQSGYLAELDPTGTGLVWATYLGSGNVVPNFNPEFPPALILNSIVFDTVGNVVVTGNRLAITGAAASGSKSNSASVVKITLSGTSLSNMAVQNAAGFLPGLPAPGGLAALYVNGITETGTFTAPGLPLPTELGGVTVLVDGVKAPLLAVVNTSTGTQINFQVPFELWTGEPEPHVVEVQYSGLTAFIVPEQAGPGIFLLPDGGGAIQHASDNSTVTVQNPVRRGEILVIYAGGLGAVSVPVASGEESTGADPIGPNACNQVTTNAGTVLYAGLSPGFPGLYQVNVQVSQYLPPGVTYIYLQSQACWDEIPPTNVSQGNAVAIYIPQ